MTSKDDYMDNTIPTNNSYINTYLNTNINTNMATYFLYNMNYTQPYILSNLITPSNVITPIVNPDTTNSATDNGDIDNGDTDNGDTMNGDTDIIPTNEYNDINPPLFNHIYDIVLTNNQYVQIIAFLNSIY